MGATWRKPRDPKDGAGKVVLITGCSAGGIGHAIAEEFHRRGARVYATSRRLEAMRALKEQGMHTLQLDVTSEPSIKAAVAEVISSAGRLDVLVNNAGYGIPNPAATLPMPKLREVFDTNFFGAVALSQEVFPLMLKHKFGRIVNISSVASYTHRPYTSAYSASKAALNAISNCMRIEMKPFGIGVVLVTPGYIRTNIFSKTAATVPDIPANSPYKHVQGNIEESYRKRAQDTNMPSANELATRVVDASLSARPPIRVVFVEKASAGTVGGSLPLWLQDYFYWKLFGEAKNL